MTNSRPLTTERLTAGCDSPNLLLNDACDTPSGDRDAVDYRYKLLENGTILFSPVEMSKFKSWPLGDVFDFVDLFDYPATSAHSKVTNFLSPGVHDFEMLLVSYLQILYGKNVIHVNNADDKIDNSEQEQDLGGTA